MEDQKPLYVMINGIVRSGQQQRSSLCLDAYIGWRLFSTNQLVASDNICDQLFLH